MNHVSQSHWWGQVQATLGPGAEASELTGEMRDQLERRLRIEVIGRQLATCLSYGLVQLGCLWFTPMGRDHWLVCAASTVVQLALGALRLGLGWRYSRTGSEVYYFWNRRSSYVVGALWSIYVTFAVTQYGLSSGSILPLLGTAAALTGSPGALSADLRLARPFVCLLAAPMLIWGFGSSTPGALSVGFGGAVGLSTVLVMLNHTYRALVSGQIALLKLERHTAELNAARQAAEQATIAKSMFLANMSHEIRTPLTGVIGLTGMLAETTLDPKQKELLKGIRSSGEMLLSLVNDVLDYSKIAAGKLEIHNTSVHLRGMAGEAVAPFRRLAVAKGVAVRLVIDSMLPAWISVDPVRIRQVLSNLIGNAVKFTPSGAIVVEILPDGGCRSMPSRIRFSVKDSGIGMGPDAISRLFREFSQADGSTTRQYGGTGLGLAISKRLIEGMGGGIGVESTPGQGSLFWATLPLVEASAPPVAAIAETNVEKNIPPLKILIAEDAPVNQIILRNLVTKMGHSVEVVGNGRLAYEAVQRAAFDMILMDWHMPEMDAVAATAAIRKLPSCAGLPIIAVTANVFEEDRERCLAAGMNDHVGKPIRLEELRQAIGRWAPVVA